MARIRLGFKISLGFTILLAVTLALGGLAIVKMKSVSSLQGKLDQAYLEQVAAVSRLERHWSQAVFDLNAYALSSEKPLLERGRQNLSLVKEDLRMALELAGGFPELSDLQERATAALTLLDNYEKLMAQTAEAKDQLSDYQDFMDSAQDQFFQNAYELLHEENQNLAKEISTGEPQERVAAHQARIVLLSQIIEMGSQAWLSRPKIMAGADASTVETVQKTVEEMRAKYDDLVSMCRREPQVQMKAASSRSAAEQFKAILTSWLEQGQLLQELRGKRENLSSDLTVLAQEASEAGLRGVKKLSGQTVDSLSSASHRVLEGAGSALVLGLLLSLVLSRSITRPIRAAVAQLGQGAEQVALTSEHISRASQVLADGSSQQAASLEESSASLEQMAAMTKDTTTYAQQANVFVNQTGQALDMAATAMNQLTAVHEPHRRRQQADQKDRQGHRRHRLPDQLAGPQRRRGGGPGRPGRGWVRGGGRRGAQPGHQDLSGRQGHRRPSSAKPWRPCRPAPCWWRAPTKALPKSMRPANKPAGSWTASSPPAANRPMAPTSLTGRWRRLTP